MVTDDIAYAEVFETLSYMNKKTVMKIPLEVLQYIRENRNMTYISRIDPNNIFNPKNISKEARTILAWLDLEYLASKESKKEKMKIYQENERKYQENLRKKYNSDDIFKNKIAQEEIKTSEETRITVVQEEKWYQKIFTLIKNLFKRD